MISPRVRTSRKTVYVSKLAGQDVVSVEVNKQIMGSQASALIVALLLVLACLIIGFNSLLIGGLALLPVLFVLMLGARIPCHA